MKETRNTLFASTPKGCWSHVSDQDWGDWHWQLRHRVTTLEALTTLLPLTESERLGAAQANSKLALGITPYFFNLIDPANPHCPIRRQVVPRIEEMSDDPSDMEDPCGEDDQMPVPGLVHRYPDRVLFLVTDRCASYCRYCTRSRVVSGVGERQLDTDHDAALDYIERHSSIRDVLLSGGDPLLLSDEKLDRLLGRLRAIPHVEFLRIGSRIPIFLPQRITPALTSILKKYHPLWMSIHANHPRELTAESKQAIERLVDAGVPIGNQSVLLRGINDNTLVMRQLLHKLLQCRARPYYLYQCDLIRGSSHLRTSIRQGIEMIQSLRGHTTGYAVPQFVVDGPGGGGKIPLNPDYILAHDGTNLILRNYKGEIYEYPDPESAIHFPPFSSYHDELVGLGAD